jgi:hypothetical protein
MNRTPQLIQADPVVGDSDNSIDNLIEELNLISFDKAEKRAAKEARIKLSKKRLRGIYR